jgi:class 3 adenylate cyclase/CHASE2 domain-containing sensor protein
MSSPRQGTTIGRLPRVVLGRVAIAAAVLLTLVVVAPWLSFIEVRALDFLYALRPPRPPDPRVQIIDIGDDPSVYGRLRDPRDTPTGGCEIPRRAYAEAVRRLSRWGAKVIVFDLMFRRSCEYEDGELADAFRQAGNVIVAASTKVEPGAVGLKDPVEPLGGAVWAVGSPVAHQPNEAVRSVPMVVRDRDRGREYLALSLLAFQRFTDVKPSEMRLREGNWLVSGDRRVPLLSGERMTLLPFAASGGADDRARNALAAVEVVRGSNVELIPGLKTWNSLLINWTGPQGTMRPLALSGLLAIGDDAQGRKLFEGKAVIIGQEDWDVHWTSLGAMPGLEVQANALQTLLSGAFVRPVPPWGTLGLLTIFIFATESAVRRFKGVRGIGAILLLMVAGVVLARQLLIVRGTWMYLFYCELGIGLTWGMTSLAESGRATALLTRFIPSFIGKPEAAGLGRVRTMDASLLFSDIRGYTSAAEQLPAAEVMAMLTTYHSAVEDVITKYGGTIVKTPGDAVLAVFWREVKGLNHATCALLAGEQILRELPEKSQPWEEVGVQLDIGIGINTGRVAMGLVGKRHLEPTVIGDAVNVAQRLESLTKTLKRPLIFSESVRELLPEEARSVYLDEVTVRGRQMPLKIYGLGGPDGTGREPEQCVGSAGKEVE